jgi:hypothetical protein
VIAARLLNLDPAPGICCRGQRKQYDDGEGFHSLSPLMISSASTIRTASAQRAADGAMEAEAITFVIEQHVAALVSLCPGAGTCYFAPNICSSLPSWLDRQRADVSDFVVKQPLWCFGKRSLCGTTRPKDH